MGMLRMVLSQAMMSLRRNPLRSFLTMLGVIWGIVSIALLLAYGSSFRKVLVASFEAFGKSVVICWPGRTGEQAGGERAGKAVVFEQEDVERIREEAPLVKQACLETVRWLPISYGTQLANTAIRGVCPAYGEMRNEVASRGRWISADDFLERRRVVFLGNRIREKLFHGKPPVGETVSIGGLRFTVIGEMEIKLQDSNYFTSDDDSVFIPYTAAGYLWDTRYASTLVFTPISLEFENQAIAQVRAAVARRQNFSPTDERAMPMFGRLEVKPIIDGITIGIQALLAFIGVLTLGIGGVGVMNIMLVSVDERVREIGVRRALGARRWHIQAQFLAEALTLTLLGGVIGIAAAYALSAAIGPLPFYSAIFKEPTGRGDIHLYISLSTVAITSGVLILVGVLAGLAPAIRASQLDPAEALRYE